MPAISLLIPIYNVEKYLRECLDSVLAQSFTDFEAICINDGSTDSSRAIVQEYLDADGRFRVIDKSNSGYGASMNQGLDAATGKYVAILESDDAFTPDALEVLYNLATTHNAQAVKADFWFYWSQNEKLEPCHVISEGLAASWLTLRKCLSLSMQSHLFGRACTTAPSYRKMTFASWRRQEHRIRMLALPLRYGRRRTRCV